MAKPLRIQCFMHVPFEGPGVITDWITKNKHELKFTRFYEGDDLPGQSSIDFLVIMGGPMNVFDFHIHPWMQEEMDWVSEFIHAGKPVLGICLGAQIIAASLGTEVYPGNYKEIGWHNLKYLPSLGNYMIFKDFPSTRKVFHWHGDTCQIPAGAIRIAESQAFSNQGFIYNGRVIALQFHLELTPESVREMVDNCGGEIVPGQFIQTKKEILEETRYFKGNQKLMFRFLDYLSSLAR
ncbi:MAG: type 1 glutamine amidotransferase [Bacteroidota bacterium]